MKVLATILGTVLMLGAGSGAATSGTTVVRSGLHGVVLRGPVTPICTAEEPCSEPAAGAVLVFSRGGRDVARSHVQTDGRYRITLPAGMYAVRLASLRRLEPHAARVIAGRFRHVDFSIDTGIR